MMSSVLLLGLLFAVPAKFPAPDPVSIPIDANLKFASGTVEWFDDAHHVMVVKCPAGPVTFHIDRLAIMGPDRKPRTLADVRSGMKVQVWYHIDRGANAAELELLAPAAHPSS